jgi:hypothetical protein
MGGRLSRISAVATVLVFVAALGLLATCGGSSHGAAHANGPTTGAPVVAAATAGDAATRLGLTAELPLSISRTCRRLQRRLDREGTARQVICPPLVPTGPARAEGSPLAGVRAGRPGRSYIIDVHSPDLPASGDSDGHWLTAAGTRSGLRIAGLVDLVTVPRTPVRLAGYPGAIERMPPYPHGGVNGGHVVVTFRAGALVYLVSLHGRGNTVRAVAMTRALARAVRQASDDGARE